MGTGIRVLLYALVAATSPLALGATIAVLTSARGRLNGTAFAIGTFIGQSVVWLILVLVGGSWVPDGDGDRSTLFLLVELAFGVALLVAAFHVRRHPSALTSGTGERAAAIRDRLRRLSPGTALGTGVALGVGGPKRLGVTLLAAATIAAADIPTGEEVALATTYVLIATALVWVPVLLYVIFGRSATDWIERAQRVIAEHRSTVLFYPSLVVGLVLIGDAIVELTTG
jgi:Sap, sulfolipid-1-addressing protein